MPVLNTAKNLLLGTTQVAAVYAGETKIFPPPFTPAALPSLAAWFDASQDTFTDGQAISSYVEHSAAGRSFTAVAGSEPIWRAGGGRPYIDIVANGLTSTVPWNPGSVGLTYFFAGRMIGGQYPMMIVWGPDPDGVEMRHDGAAQQIVLMYSSTSIYYSHPTPSGYAQDNVYMLRVDVSTRTSHAWTNASKYIGPGPSAMPNAARTLYLGRREGGYPFIGRVYEALVCAGPVSDTEVSTVYDYLRAKWAMP